MEITTLKRLTFAALAVLMFSSVTHAEDGSYSDGLAAFSQKQYTVAVEIWLPLAEGGHSGAQFNLGRMYDEGVGVAENDVIAVSWYQRASESDFAPAMVQYALALVEGKGGTVDTETAVVVMRRAAEAGDAEAQFQMGKFYRDGVVVQKDYFEAVRWYQAAADQGHTRGQYRLGFMYGSGYGVPQDFVQAYYYYGLAAEQMPISASAQSHLTEYMTVEELTLAEALINGTPKVAAAE
jgi:TPR repeat protein